VDQHCYLKILARLREAVRRRRPELWPDAWILHHDNAPAHDALAVREFWVKTSIMQLEHIPYSPDLAPCDFWLFWKQDRFEGPQFFRHCRHSGIATSILQSTPEEEFQKYFGQWKHRLTKCIGVQGDYFKGDSNH
jgi:histone-lysine N-methyltransferase SETMAR